MLKCLVKCLVVLKNSMDTAVLVFEQFELKPFLYRARVLDRELVHIHHYAKCTKHVDFFELSLCNYYLNNEEYGRLSRKYLGRNVEAWQ